MATQPEPISAKPSATSFSGAYVLGIQGGVTKKFPDTVVLAGAVKSTTILNAVKITQAAYTALATKDSATLYVIVG